MKIGARPTDDQILAALKRAAGASYAATYVIRNWLAAKEFGQFDDLNTSHVLYRLRRLEKQGSVREVIGWGNLHKYWEIAE